MLWSLGILWASLKEGQGIHWRFFLWGYILPLHLLAYLGSQFRDYCGDSDQDGNDFLPLPVWSVDLEFILLVIHFGVIAKEAHYYYRSFINHHYNATIDWFLLMLDVLIDILLSALLLVLRGALLVAVTATAPSEYKEQSHDDDDIMRHLTILGACMERHNQ